MTSATKASYAVTSRYAIALIELATEQKQMEKVEQDLQDLAAMMTDSPDLAALINSPVKNRGQMEKALWALADKAKFHNLTKNFLGVLVKNRRLYALQAIIEAVRAELSKRRGEITVQVETAQDLTDAQKQKLQQALAKGMDREVSLKAKVEPGILGGMIVTVGSRMIDDSVRRKLQRLKAAMGRQANQNINDKTKEVG